MADEQDNTGELTSGETADTEKLLASFAPRGASTNVAQLMFLAGREAATAELARRDGISRWLWPCATAAATIVAVTFAVLLAMRGEPAVRIVEKPAPIPAPAQASVQEVDSDNPTVDDDARNDDDGIVPKPIPRTTQTMTAISPNRGSYLRTRDLVLKHGLEAIPSFAPTRGVSRDDAVSLHELRKTMLPRGAAPRADSPTSQSIWHNFLLDGENL